MNEQHRLTAHRARLGSLLIQRNDFITRLAAIAKQIEAGTGTPGGRERAERLRSGPLAKVESEIAELQIRIKAMEKETSWLQ